LSAKSGAGCHYILIISDRGTNIIGQFFLFRRVDLLIRLIIEIKYYNYSALEIWIMENKQDGEAILDYITGFTKSLELNQN
jgi:hypothetical protein